MIKEISLKTNQGDERDKTHNPIYYVISVGWKSGGQFALYKTVMSYLIYASERGYIPVIDMQHLYNQYFKDGREYKDNVWEYFFNQPCNISLKDIPKDANLIMSSDTDIVDIALNEYICLKDLKQAKKTFGKYFSYTKFNDKTQKYLDENLNKITNGEPDILGILCRGTDYLNCKPVGHAVQPDPHIVIEKAKKLLDKYNYKKIWLATEDKNIYLLFKSEFGDMLIDNKQYKYDSTSDKRIYQIKVERENHFYNLAKEYLLSIYILSKCKYIIGGITAGTLGALFLSNGFENKSYTYFWDLGVYRNSAKGINFLNNLFSIKNRIYNGKKYKLCTILGIKLKIRKKLCQS